MRLQTSLKIMIAVMALAACKRTEHSVTKMETREVSAVISTEVVKLDTLVRRADTARISGIPVQIDSNGKAQLAPVELKGTTASIRVTIKDGRLEAVSTCDSLLHVVESRDRTISELKDRTEVREDQTERVRYSIPRWAWTFMAVGLLAILGWVVWLILKLKP